MRGAGDAGRVREAHVLHRVFDLEDVVLKDCVGAELIVAARTRTIDAEAALAPLPVAGDEAQERDRAAAGLGGDRRQVVERGFGRCVENVVARQGRQACRLIDRERSGFHE